VQVDVGSDEVWGLKSGGSVYRCSADGDGEWMSVSGNFVQIAVGRMFVWGINSQGRIFYCPVSSPGEWIEVENTYNLTQIDTGSEEVWGVNATGAVYRISAAGVGSWQVVPGTLDYVTIGNDYVWGLDGTDTKNMEIDGFYCADPALGEDISGDNVVNVDDLSEVSGQWQVSDCTDPDWCNGTDINRDGAVNVADLLQLSEAWLKTDIQSGRLELLDENSDLDLTGTFTYLVGVGDITASCPLAVSDGQSSKTFVGDIDADGPYPPIALIDGYAVNYTKGWQTTPPSGEGLSPDLGTILGHLGVRTDSGASPLRVTLDVVPGRTYKLQLAWYYGWADGRNYLFDVYIEGRTSDRTGWFSRDQNASKPTLYLSLSKQQLRQAPTVTSVSVDRLNNKQLQQQIDSFYSQYSKSRISGQMDIGRQQQDQQTQQTAQTDRTYGQQDQMEQSDQMTARRTDTGQMNLLLASEVIGLDLQSPTDVDLGSIEDVVIDAQQGHVAYGLVSFGGFLNVGEKTAAVPWSSLSVEMPQQVARIDATREKLEAAVVDEQNPIAQLSQPDNARRFHENFGAEPYWGVYGYVPGQAAGSFDAWKSGSSFNRKFDPGKVTSVQGTIQSISTFEPERGAASGIQLKVKTSEGDTMTVYTGPQQYIQQQDISLSSGKKIEVTGSKVQMDGQTVILASQITSDNQTVQLRDSQGNPQWNLQEDTYRQSDRTETQRRQSDRTGTQQQRRQQEQENY